MRPNVALFRVLKCICKWPVKVNFINYNVRRLQNFYFWVNYKHRFNVYQGTENIIGDGRQNELSNIDVLMVAFVYSSQSHKYNTKRSHTH